jgi:hypothetical protein
MPVDKRIISELFRYFKLLAFRDKLLFLQTLFWILVCKMGLKIGSYRLMARLLFIKLKYKERDRTRSENSPTIQKIISLVNLIGDRLFEANCLCNAMVIKHMLAKRNCAVKIRIGVTSKDGTHLSGHAWVEKDGKILLGGSNSFLFYIPVHEDSLLFKRFFLTLCQLLKRYSTKSSVGFEYFPSY